ncbi:hypothetical protein ROHU_030933 [Labeo rohita]|uniref:Uncharacterized protein n=1 Tax=Labeo rohita TaxID=84645 RepID=A0A498LP31_LABRO|nr:hypothetical protein ROHU_030933 [Labeo rohita]
MDYTRLGQHRDGTGDQQVLSSDVKWGIVSSARQAGEALLALERQMSGKAYLGQFVRYCSCKMLLPPWSISMAP